MLRYNFSKYHLYSNFENSVLEIRGNIIIYLSIYLYIIESRTHTSYCRRNYLSLKIWSINCSITRYVLWMLRFERVTDDEIRNRAFRSASREAGRYAISLVGECSEWRANSETVLLSALRSVTQFRASMI